MHVKILSVIVVCFSIVMGCSEDGRNSVDSAEKNKIINPPVVVQSVTQAEREQPEPERALKIGVIGPETGNESSYGLSVLDGVMLAAETFNANGGIDGKKLEVLHFDNKGDSDFTREGVYKLIQQNVIAIFAAPTGWSTFSATHMINASHTIFVAVGTRRRIARSGSYIFRVSLADEIATDELIAFSSRKSGFTDYALVTSSDYVYSLDLSSLFRKAVAKYGGKLTVVADTYDTYSGKQNIDNVIKAVKNSAEPLHAIIYTGGHEEGALLAKKIKGAGLKLPIIGGEDLYTNAYLKQGGDAVRGTLLYSTFAPDRKLTKVENFVRDYQKKKANTPDRFVALAYDSFMLVAEAIKEAGSTRSSVVRDALTKIHYRGVTGDTAFSPDGAPVKHPFIYRVEASKTGDRFVLLSK